MATHLLQSRIGWCARARVAMTVLLVLGGVAFYLMGYRPGMQMLHHLRSLGEAQHAEFLLNQEKVRLLPAVQVDVMKLSNRVAEFEKKLSKQTDHAAFVHDVAAIGQRASLHKFTLLPGVLKRDTDSLNEQLLTLSFEGDFFNIFSFLRQIEDMQRLMRIKSVTVMSKDSSTGQVELKMAMTVYFQE